jgi:5-methyltetrahydrofolate corrinoid/iron sulfur protein methyltransferase
MLMLDINTIAYNIRAKIGEEAKDLHNNQLSSYAIQQKLFNSNSIYWHYRQGGNLMIIISERINGQFKSVGKAIDEKDEEFIKNLAKDQVAAGADYLDISTGPGVENAADVMVWMVNAVQSVVDVPLCIDTPQPETMTAGVAAVKGKVMINSTTAEMEKMTRLFELAKKHDAEIICLTLDEQGIPNDTDKRCELAMLMIATSMEYEIPAERLFLDPLVLPTCAAQDQGPKVIDALRMFKTLNEPPVSTVVGLSNISNGTKNKELINRTYATMLMANGLDSAIMDPSDTALVEAVRTGEILMNKKLYAHDYLRECSQ